MVCMCVARRGPAPSKTPTMVYCRHGLRTRDREFRFRDGRVTSTEYCLQTVTLELVGQKR